MYGQKELIQKIDILCENELPHLILLIGDNSEKIDIYKYISRKIESKLNLCNIGVDEIREVINNSYKVKDKILYVFEDAERMSTYAQNALLKITEEPPKNCYFIISFKNKNQIISTIQSRGFTLEMNSYSYSELSRYMKERYNYDDDKIRELINIVSTLNQVDIISNYDLDNFYNLIEKIIQFLPTASIANALKISQNVKIKDDGDGYDMEIFLKCLLSKYSSKCNRNDLIEIERTTNTIKCINKALYDLESSKYSKQSIMDSVILGVHQIWNY